MKKLMLAKIVFSLLLIVVIIMGTFTLFAMIGAMSMHYFLTTMASEEYISSNADTIMFVFLLSQLGSLYLALRLAWSCPMVDSLWLKKEREK